tara:strand:+ start:72 stop:500 length:429 start_codon:yes stop_codon:yes gene_type:complete
MLKKLIPHFFLICFPLTEYLLAAENYEILLSIEGNLLGRIELLPEDSDPQTIITSYYDILPLSANIEINDRQSALEEFLPDYKVAYLAADSAEMAELRYKIDSKWAKISGLHSQFFTSEVIRILNTAYVAKFGDLLPEIFNP